MQGADALETLATSPWAYVAAFVLGTLWGSFANVCIYRWPPTDEHPKGRSVVAPGSHCFACGAAVRWYDNVPLLSYLWLRGRCRDCGAGFSARYLMVEALTGLLFALAWYVAVVLGGQMLGPEVGEALGDRMIRFGVMAAFSFTMVVITFIDLDHQLILDRMTYPAIPVFYGLGLLLPERSWMDGLIGAAVGYGLIRLISDGYFYLTKREGLGYGDGKLLAVVGALLGWRGVLFSLFGGSLIGSVIGVGVVIVARARDGKGEGEGSGPEPEETGEKDVALRHTALPFGPFLAAAALAYLFAEPYLWAVFPLALPR